ncbi:MAG: TatD family hydrolase [Acidobacteria bacterium]|nr:TatD family hydrolase [Acidobacteriota bacterium]
MWIDSHCHIPAGDEGDAAVVEAVESGVDKMVDVGCDLETSLKAIDNARRHKEVSATVGVHPHEAAGGIAGIEDLIATEGVVAIGEAGLDYFYEHSPRAAQADVFVEQISMAHRYDLPLVIHTRDAWADTFALLGEHRWPRRTILHCFTGGVAEAEHCLEHGATLSFSGIVTFPNAADVAAAATACPLERLLVETDSPYLAPVPHRGKRNRPAWVCDVGAKIATLHGVDVVTVAAVTSATAQELYSLPEV